MEKNLPLVSVVIPAYNVGGYIEECIGSVQGQTYGNLEIIVVDDGSTDDTLAVCMEAAAGDARVTVLHRENGGVVAARNAGLGHAHGEYIAFVDGDDWIERDMIEELAGRIGRADMASVGVFQEKAKGRMEECTDRFEPGVYAGERQMDGIYGRMLYDRETGYMHPLTPWIYNKLYVCSKAKEIHKRVGRDITYAEDSVFLFLYLLECRSIAFSRRCLYHYRYREGSAVHAPNERMLTDVNRVYLSLKEAFRGHRMERELLFQLQTWVAARVCDAVNGGMGFDGRIRIPLFTADVRGLEGKRLALYGAGAFGRDAYRQLRKFGYDVVLWVDRAYGRCREEGLDVDAPEMLGQCGYDMVVIAIEDERTAGQVKDFLAGLGVTEEAVVWRKPLRFY